MDRVETGWRANYGVQTSIRSTNGSMANAVFGQNYRTKQDQNFKLGSGMDDLFSDYVGKVGVSPTSKMNISYRFRLDKSNFSIHRSEVDSDFNLAPVLLTVSYIDINQDILGENPDRKEIDGAISTALSKEWTIAADGRKNLTSGGGVISTGLKLLYHGDCLDLNLAMVKQYTTVLDVVPSTAFTFQVYLKNINKPPQPQ